MLLSPQILIPSTKATVVAVAATSWSNSDKNIDITLTNSNRTATSGAAGYKGVRAVASASTGKFYYEVHIDTNPASELIMAGIANATFGVSASSFLGQDNNSISFDPNGVFTWLNSVNIAAPSGATGDTMGIAVDIGGTTFQCNINGGAFTSRSFATMAAGPYFPALVIKDATTAATATFSSTSWAFSPPAGGYGQWQ